VLDNQAATLQVGDQVPFSTGTATVLTANNTVVNTTDYKNTGIILRVLPRANSNGNVVLDIEQEISSVAAGCTGSLTPTISPAPRQELDCSGERPVRAARRPDQPNREQTTAGYTIARFNSGRWRRLLTSDQHARPNRIDPVHPPDADEGRRRCARHRRGNAHQNEQPPGRHPSAGGRGRSSKGSARAWPTDRS
jgi:hypothetical protein